MNGTRLWGSFATQAEKRPDAVALVWHGESISYGELHDLACRAQAGIERLGAAPGEIVGVPATKSPATVAVALACLRSGRPVMLPSATLPGPTMEQMFARAGCRHVVRSEHILAAAVAGDVDVQPASSASPEDSAFILTTSGSTGLPKLVPLGVGAVERFADWASEQFDLGPEATVLNYAPLNFDLCFLDIWTTLHHGGRVVLVDPDVATNGEHLLGLIADNEVTVMQAVPMLFRLIVDAAGEPAKELPTVRHLMFTGDHMPPPLLARLPELFPAARLYNIYGCTETNDSFIHEVHLADLPQTAVPLGAPLPGVEAVIVDEDGAVVTDSGRGELLVATPFQTAGYIGTSRHGVAENDGKFVLRPHGDRVRRFFRTGDIVRRDAAGQVHLEGRNDFQVKVRGTRVNTAEVEQTLLEHDGVVEAAVVAVPDPLAGHLLHSLVQRGPAVQLNSLVLRQYCAERMPRAAIPSTLRLVDDPLPKTSTGKVDRKLVAQAFTRPDPRATTARKETSR